MKYRNLKQQEETLEWKQQHSKPGLTLTEVTLQSSQALHWCKLMGHLSGPRGSSGHTQHWRNHVSIARFVEVRKWDFSDLTSLCHAPSSDLSPFLYPFPHPFPPTITSHFFSLSKNPGLFPSHYQYAAIVSFQSQQGLTALPILTVKWSSPLATTVCLAFPLLSRWTSIHSHLPKLSSPSDEITNIFTFFWIYCQGVLTVSASTGLSIKGSLSGLSD